MSTLWFKTGLGGIMFSAVADLHLRTKTPKYRKDNFHETQFQKFERLLKYTSKYVESKILVTAGDIFDSKGVNYTTVATTMGLLLAYDNVLFFVVPGQHDLKYHRQGLEGTPLGVLLQLPNVKLLTGDTQTVGFPVHSLTFVGGGWNEEPTAKGDVFVTHRMVTAQGPLWPGQTDYISGKALLKKYKGFKYIISGDNHRPHKITVNKRTNINCGSMCRTNKDQYKYKPAFWHIHEDGTIQKVAFGVKKASAVFDTDRIVQDEKFEADKERFAFVTDNITTKLTKPDFERILNHTITQAKISDGAKEIISLKMEELNGY